MPNIIPGLNGFVYGQFSSLDRRAIAKLTDTNHLESLHVTDPQDYDRQIISLYSQTSLFANDLLDMMNQSTPFYIDSNTDSWKWKVQVPFKFPKIIQIPDATQTALNANALGIDGREFALVLDTNEFAKNSIVSLGSRMYGPQLYVTSDPEPYEAGFIQFFTLLAENGKSDVVSAEFVKVGVELELVNGSIGEFDDSLLALPRLGQTIQLFQTLGSGYGFQHTITEWADDRTPKDSTGKPLDLIVFAKRTRGELGDISSAIRWEPFIESQLRAEMLSLKVKRMIWAKPGTVRTGGSQQELKKVSAGIYHTMRRFGNYAPYNRGQLTTAFLRNVFGDLFYRRVDVSKRYVKMYTNEAGFDAFSEAIRKDVSNSGLVLNAGEGNRFLRGEGQSIVYDFNFNSFVSRETGKVELVHLRELDLPQSNVEFGQNKKSTPVFLVFDISDTKNGSLKNNVREVRMKNAPSMTWGYVDGTRHHLGFAKSQGMSSANLKPGYTIWMKDRCDVFIEDPLKTVLIEEIPQF
jgi:hypothetical protein